MKRVLALIVLCVTGFVLLGGCTATEHVKFTKNNGRWEAVEAQVPWTYFSFPASQGLWLTNIRSMEARLNQELPVAPKSDDKSQQQPKK